jgi:hypothetical protein
MRNCRKFEKTDKHKIIYKKAIDSANNNISKANMKYHNLTKKQWLLFVNLIRECELTEDGALTLMDEVKKGNIIL